MIRKIETIFNRSEKDGIPLNAKHINKIKKTTYYFLFIPVYSFEIILSTNL